MSNQEKNIPDDWAIHGLKVVKKLSYKQFIAEYLTTLVEDDSTDPPQKFICLSSRANGIAGLVDYELLVITLPKGYQGSLEDWAEQLNEQIIQVYLQRNVWTLNQLVDMIRSEAIGDGMRAIKRRAGKNGPLEGKDRIDLEDELLRGKKEYLKRLTNWFAEDAKRRLDIRDNRKSSIEFNNLAGVHESLKVQWQGAKEIANWIRKNRPHLTRDEWLERIKHDYMSFPNELLLGLRTREFWSPDLQRMLDSKGSASDVFAISLEHAARVSGWPFYGAFHLTIRQLQTRLKQSKTKMK